MYLKVGKNSRCTYVGPIIGLCIWHPVPLCICMTSCSTLHMTPCSTIHMKPHWAMHIQYEALLGYAHTVWSPMGLCIWNSIGFCICRQCICGHIMLCIHKSIGLCKHRQQGLDFMHLNIGFCWFSVFCLTYLCYKFYFIYWATAFVAIPIYCFKVYYSQLSCLITGYNYNF